MPSLRIVVVGALAVLSLDAMAEEKERCGPYDGVDLTEQPKLLAEILAKHAECSFRARRRLMTRAEPAFATLTLATST